MSETRNNGCTTCAEPGCERCPANGDVLYRVNPKGQKGIVMCSEHEYKTWHGAQCVVGVR